jgi:hypothetical protein
MDRRAFMGSLAPGTLAVLHVRSVQPVHKMIPEDLRRCRALDPRRFPSTRPCADCEKFLNLYRQDLVTESRGGGSKAHRFLVIE